MMSSKKPKTPQNGKFSSDKKHDINTIKIESCTTRKVSSKSSKANGDAEIFREFTQITLKPSAASFAQPKINGKVLPHKTIKENVTKKSPTKIKTSSQNTTVKSKQIMSTSKGTKVYPPVSGISSLVTSTKNSNILQITHKEEQKIFVSSKTIKIAKDDKDKHDIKGNKNCVIERDMKQIRSTKIATSNTSTTASSSDTSIKNNSRNTNNNNNNDSRNKNNNKNESRKYSVIVRKNFTGRKSSSNLHCTKNYVTKSNNNSNNNNNNNNNSNNNKGKDEGAKKNNHEAKVLIGSRSSIKFPRKFSQNRESPNTLKSQRITEKTIFVQLKRVFRNGKWLEETTKTETLTNEHGTKKLSEKTTIRDLAQDEILAGTAEKPYERNRNFRTGYPDSYSDAGDIRTSNRALQRRVRTRPAVRDDQESFARQVLISINGYRRTHGVPPLEMNEKLTRMAKDWADRLARTEQMEHGDFKNVGENIYCKTSSQPWFEMSGAEVVDNWYNEVDDHNYDEEPSQGYLKTGHFTQLVWKDTKDLGVAFARNKNGHMAFVVAYFEPKGNWIGEFREQVLPPGGAAAQKKRKKRRSRTGSQQSIASDSTNASSRRRKTKSKTRNSADSSTSDNKGDIDNNSKDDNDNSSNPRTPDSETGSQKRRGREGGRNLAFSPLLLSFAEESFYDDCLNAHNYYREIHDVQPLKLNKELCEYAQEWANQMAEEDVMDHRMENDFGENIYMKWSDDPDFKIPGEEAVDAWYEENKDFNYGKEPTDLSAGHFTQMIWEDSEELGVGVAKSDSGKIYVVANYDPPGNYLGQFSKMVKPPVE